MRATKLKEQKYTLDFNFNLPNKQIKVSTIIKFGKNNHLVSTLYEAGEMNFNRIDNKNIYAFKNEIQLLLGGYPEVFRNEKPRKTNLSRSIKLEKNKI